ncbi:MAG: UDP-N-acetylglucosamine 2-epimerase [Acidaminococcaceae bacterium]|nr:UDP-N-acetylglucosamine 2-epimerase [Acidaminococcaceae bacterium]
MKICTIIGVRPQFVKAAVLSPIIRKEHKEILIHTGQHHDENLSAVFFHELELPEPDYMLTVSGGTGQERIESMVHQLEPVLKKENADAVLIYGDTNSTLAGALSADKLKIPVIHVEAGERNGLANNPEEQIRMRVDQLSSLLLCSSRQAMKNLQTEGLGAKAHYIGNLMEVSFSKNIVKKWKPRLVRLSGCQKIVIPDKYILLTCHRQENSNDRCLTEILSAMEGADFPVIFPVHPRNKERVLKIYRELKLRNVILVEPAGYFDSIHLIKDAEIVVTDSGGVLQEAHFTHTPYVFVMDIANPPANTKFDVSRLVRPKRDEISKKVNKVQIFGDFGDKRMYINSLENKVLHLLQDFQKN